MDTSTVIPPLPPGFKLESGATAGATGAVPPLPPGFKLEQPSVVQNLHSTPPAEHPTMIGQIGQMLQMLNIGTNRVETVDGYPDTSNPYVDLNQGANHQPVAISMSSPYVDTSNMKPGLERGALNLLTPANVLTAAAAPVGVETLMASGIGKLLLSLGLAKLGQQGLIHGTEEAKKAISEPAGGQRREDILNAGVDYSSVLPGIGIPWLKGDTMKSGIRPEDFTPASRFEAGPLGVRDLQASGQPSPIEARPVEARPVPPQQPTSSVRHELPAATKSDQLAILSAIPEEHLTPLQKRTLIRLQAQATKDIVPAVKVGDKVLTATPEQVTHTDVLKANNLSPKDIPHTSPQRGFRDLKTGRFLTRLEAEKLTGINGTAKNGGLDSLDLPRAKGYESEDYSPEDLARYKELHPQTIPSTLEQVASPEYSKIWSEFEQLRNKYNGMPPKQLAKTKQPIESELPNAKGIRSNKKQSGKTGQIGQGLETNRGNDVEQTSPEQHKSLDKGEKTQSTSSSTTPQQEGSKEVGDASTGRVYGGLPFLDPEFWKNTIKDWSSWTEKARRVQLPSTRPLGWSPYYGMTHEDRVKAILLNPDAVKLEDHPMLRAQPGEKTPLSLRVNNKIKKVVNAAALVDKIILPRDAVLDLIGGGHGTYTDPITQHFGWSIDDAFQRSYSMLNYTMNRLSKIKKKYNLTAKNGERIGVYAVAQQENGLARLKASGVEQGTIDKINSTISEGELEWYNEFRKIDEGFFPYVQKLAKELYGIDVKHVLNHFPFMRDFERHIPALPETALPKGTSTEEQLVMARDLMADYGHLERSTKTEQGFTIEREPKAKTFIRYDAFNVADRFLHDVIHFLTHQKLLKELGEVARSPKFLDKYGELGQKLIVDWLNTVTTRGQYSRQSKVLQWLRKDTSVGDLAFNPSSQLVHSANIPLGIYWSGGLKHWWRGLNAALSDEGQAFLQKHFGESFARGGGEPSLVESDRGPVTNAGFIIQKTVDRLVAQATSLGSYLRILESKGLNPADYHSLPADRAAIAESRVRARRAVASPLPKDVSNAVGRGSDWVKTFLQFENVPLDQWSNMRYDLMQTGVGEFLKAAGKGKINKAAVRKITLLTTALTTMLFWDASIKYETKEVESRLTGHGPQPASGFNKKLTQEFLRRIPGVSQVSGLLSGQTGVPIADTLKEVIDSGEETVGAISSHDTHKAKLAAESGLTAIGEIAGIPGSGFAGRVIKDEMTSSPGLADRTLMYQLAHKWMKQNNIPTNSGEFSESKYIDLTTALRRGDIDSAKSAYEELKKQIPPERIKQYYSDFTSHRFTNNKANEERFIQSLDSQQRLAYSSAVAGNEDVKRRFFSDVIGGASEPKGRKSGKFKMFSHEHSNMFSHEH